MTRRSTVWVIIKKIFSLALILNALITVIIILQLLNGFYRAWPNWQPYWPYLIDGNLLVLIAAAAIINIFPSASIGRALNTGRFLFHHYVYGSLVILSSLIYVLTFTSLSLISLIFSYTTSIDAVFGRIFFLGGLTLFLDDLPDVSERVESFLNNVKANVYHVRKILFSLQIITGIATFYIFLSMVFSSIADSSFNTANAVTMGVMLVTCLTSFAFVKKKTWLKITPPKI